MLNYVSQLRIQGLKAKKPKEINRPNCSTLRVYLIGAEVYDSWMDLTSLFEQCWKRKVLSLFFFFFLHSLTGGISETLEIEIKMGIESEGWDLKFVEIESDRIEIWEDLKEGVVV